MMGALMHLALFDTITDEMNRRIYQHRCTGPSLCFASKITCWFDFMYFYWMFAQFK